VSTKTKEHVAIKIFDKSLIKKSGTIDNLYNEIYILMGIKHPNIVQFKEVLSSKTKIYLILELIPGGDLLKYLSY